MEKNSSTFNFRRLPWGFIGSLIIFVGIQALLIQIDAFWKIIYENSKPVSLEGAIRNEALLRMIKKEKEENKKRVFILGSSQSIQSYDSKIINNPAINSTLSYFNFGAAGAAQPLDLYLIKDKLLKKNPDMIIYMPYIESFYAKYSDDPFRKLRYDFRPKVLPSMLRHLGFNETIGYLGEICESFLGDISLFYKYRRVLGDVTKRALNVQFGREKPVNLLETKLMERKPETHFKKMKEKIIRNHYEESMYTKLNEEMFSEFAEFVVSKGVKLLVISGPTNPRFRELYPQKLDHLFDKFLSEQAEEKGFIYLAQKDLPSFDDKDFVDFLHLHESGREKFTLFVYHVLMDSDPELRTKGSPTLQATLGAE